MSKRFRNKKGQFATPTDDTCVVYLEDVPKNKKAIDAQRRKAAKKRLQKRADAFLKSENPLAKGLRALQSKED